MTSPGSALFAVLVRCLDADALESVVAPTVADLQFEVQTTRNPWRRQFARARGYVAIVRLLFWHGLIWRSPMRTLLAVVVLGVAGAALLVEMFSVTTTGPAQISPFFLMTVVAPIVMRLVIGVNTRRGMFVNCMAVGTVMSVVFLGWFAIVKNPSHGPWYAYVPGLIFLLGCVALASAIIAIVTTRSEAADKRNVRGKMLAVIASAVTFAIGFSFIGLSRHHSSGGFDVLSTVSWGLFLAFFFVLVAVLIYLPILGSSRRVLHPRSRAPLAVLGAFLFPIPMLALPLLQGRLEPMVRLFLRDPIVLAAAAIPYLVAGAMLGWLIAAPRDDVQHTI
jgi:hypothetical protein